MKEYTSKQVTINKSEHEVFEKLSNFNNLTPFIGDKMNSWQATEDSCSFNVQGFDMCLRIDEKEAPKIIKLTSDGGKSPVDFNFWVQLKGTGENETRMRLVLHAELNMMMNMLIGGKIQHAIDKLADQISMAMNSR